MGAKFHLLLYFDVWLSMYTPITGVHYPDKHSSKTVPDHVVVFYAIVAWPKDMHAFLAHHHVCSLEALLPASWFGGKDRVGSGVKARLRRKGSPQKPDLFFGHFNESECGTHLTQRRPARLRNSSVAQHLDLHMGVLQN